MKLSADKQLRTFKIQNILLTIFSLLTIISITIIIIVISVMPLPERFFINQLDYIMILMGQKTSLFLIYAFAITGIVSCIVSWIFSWILYNKSFKYPKNWFLKWYIEKDPINRTSINYENKWMNVYNIIVSFVINFLAPLTFWTHWIDYRYIKYVCFNNGKPNQETLFYQQYNTFLKNSNEPLLILNNSSSTMLIKKFFVVILFPIILLIVLGLVVLSGIILYNNRSIKYNDNSGIVKNKYYNISDSNNFMTISNNNVNTIMYYFDRGQGTLFNSLIYFDYLKYGNESLMVRFPEFTSYLQSVSTTSTTNGTNPSITSSIYYSPITKNLSAINPYTGIEYCNETIKDTWTNSLVNQANMFYENGTKNFKISQVPYISTDYTGSIYGDTKWINEALSKTKSDFVSTTNESIAYTMNGFTGMNRTSDAVAWKNGPKNYHFINTDSPVYQGWYMHFTHEFYTYYDYDNNEYFSNMSNKPIDFLKVTWFAVQELKNNLQRLKDEPFYDQNGNVIGNVYDNSQIIVTSDHGYPLYGNNSEIRKLIKYVSQNSNINYDQEKVDQFIDYYVRKDSSDEILKNNTLFAFDSLLMYKPIKGTYPKIDIQNLLLFNTDTPITSSDVQLFIEAGLKRYNALKQGQSMDEIVINDSFFDKKIKGNGQLIDWINNYIVYDPLINDEKLKDRTLLLLNLKNWRFIPDSKSNEIFSYWLTNKNSLNLSQNHYLFDDNNFDLIF